MGYEEDTQAIPAAFCPSMQPLSIFPFASNEQLAHAFLYAFAEHEAANAAPEKNSSAITVPSRIVFAIGCFQWK